MASTNKKRYLIFDTETTGLPKDYNAPITDTDNWPRCIQIAWQLHDEMGHLSEHQDFIIKPDGFNIPYDAEKIHGISTDMANENGVHFDVAIKAFEEALAQADFIVGQNIEFDIKIMGCELVRAESDFAKVLQELPILDTCTEETALLCRIKGGKGGRFKLPNLTELHQYLFQVPFEEAHNATADVEATTRCFFELLRKGHFSAAQLDADDRYVLDFQEANPKPFELVGLTHVDLKQESRRIRDEQLASQSQLTEAQIKANRQLLKNHHFTHLHNYTQYSVLQSTTQIRALVDKACKEQMPAVAMTDKGNLMAAFQFVAEVYKEQKKNKDSASLIPILGCEFNVCKYHRDKSRKDNGYQVVFLAKNKQGYQNISKMSSIAHVDGFYYVPRIDKQVIETHKEDIIVLSGGFYGEISQKILNVGDKQAEEALLWWQTQFKDDFYIELVRHGVDGEDVLNPKLLQLAAQHQVKYVATNNTYYLNQSDANAHDILLCVKEGEKQATAKGRGRGFRYGLTVEEYYFKTASQMKDLFVDIPDAIINTQEIVDKITPFKLARGVLLPAFDIPKAFIDEKDQKDDGKRGENKYLRHLAYEGAKARYGTIDDALAERLDFELDVIAKTGYPGYFLIVYDLIAAARKMGVSVGPGRGSAAGSVVAYCLEITNINPIPYGLLFERFLNPERISMPDIDIDFDDRGREKVIEYVIDKYGANQVSQIITYGTMAAKSAIRDAGRVLDLSLQDTDKIAKLVPDGMKLADIFRLTDQALRAKLRSEELEQVLALKKVSDGKDLSANVVNQAKILEGSLRNTGVHACGVIITPDDITKYVPVVTAKDNKMYLSQFDNGVVESAGLLKMDFLGLKTLTIIKDAVTLVKKNYDKAIDIDAIPLDDEKTYQLFQRGDTIGIFQYESGGMRKCMRDLKPTVFEDLIAINALYRPGPMDYIPSFINRKHGKEDIKYDLPTMEKYLKETYGITVYQEQVMLLSQELADFTKGEADVLRKAMGKKQASVLEKMKPKFIEQARKNGHSAKVLEKIWKDWEAFASYAFNKSHATCYAYIAYQTAYLKAHYPSAYMAALLSNNMNDVKGITPLIDVCKKNGVDVLGPDVNESDCYFTVNKDDAIRFGMAAIKGVGVGAVEAIVAEREANGPYQSAFDMVKRLNLTTINKRVMEGLILAGAFDAFKDLHRAQYFKVHPKSKHVFLDELLSYARKYQEHKNKAQASLFGSSQDEAIFVMPAIPKVAPWSLVQRLEREKEVIGFYISGHPLDQFKYHIRDTQSLTLLQKDLNDSIGQQFNFAGVVDMASHHISKNGNGYGRMTLLDLDTSYDFMVFGEPYLSNRHFFREGTFIYCNIAVQQGYSNKKTGTYGNPRLVFTKMMLLSEVLDKKYKGLKISLPLKRLTPDFIDDLRNLLKQDFTQIPHEDEEQKSIDDSKSLSFKVFSEESNYESQLHSQNTKIAFTAELLSTLEKRGIDFKLE